MIMATKTYAEQISKAQVMLAGLRGNAELLARRGLDEAFMEKLEADRILASTYNSEQEKLKADSKTKTAQLEAKLTELGSLVSEAQKIVKMDLEQSRWREFGVDAKR